jgi:lambda family phage portal protein
MPNPLAVIASQMDRTSRRSSGLSAFSGARFDRLTADFNPYIQSPSQEVQWVLTTLRARAQALVRDNSHAAGFANELANQVIGPDGILLQAKVKTSTTDAFHTTTNDAIEAAWLEWGMPEHCTADGYESWVDFQRTVIRTIAIDGEVFIRKLRYFDNPFGFSLQIIDAELVDVTLNRAAKDGQNEIRLGIEVNRYGRPVAYHVWTSFMGDFNGKQRVRERIPADEIIHKFVRYRANQVRGVTWFAPVLLNLKNMDGYEFNELAASRAAAAKMGFILNKQPEAIGAFEWKQGQKAKQMSAEPLMIQELLPGQEFAEYNPTHPSTAYKDFMKAVLRSVARGLGMAYTTLTGDLEAVNYSSIRAGLLSERDWFRTLQRFLGVHVHRVIYREWVQMALLTGALRLDSRISSNYYAVEWRPRGWKWVDPVNDLTAAALAISLGLDSRQRLAAEQGRDFEEIVAEIAHELEIADAMGVDVSGARAPAPASSSPNEPSSNDVQDSNPDDANAVDRQRTVRALRLALNAFERMAA